MNMINNYYRKYLKYKRKYLQLKGAGFEFNLTVRQPWFDYICSGKKTVEGRLKKGLFARLRVGDQITWQFKNLKCKVTVTFIHSFKTFKELIVTEGLEKVLPGVKTVEEGVNVYRQFYDESVESQFGVVGIGMEPTKEKVNIHEGHLRDQYYTAIKSGKKPFEVRVNDAKRQKMQVGDYWIFENDDKPTKPILVTQIKSIKTFNSFGEAIQETGVQKLLPGITKHQEGVSVYESFPHDEGTYKEGAEKYGVVRFELEPQKINVHVMPIQNPKECPVFDDIKKGIKKVEGRKYTERYHKYKVGDILIFECDGEKLKTMITDIRKYATLEEYLEKEGFKNVLPCVNSFEEAVEMYNRWSTPENRDALKEKYGFGFMGIEIKIDFI